jgi:hypothetical protein
LDLALEPPRCRKVSINLGAVTGAKVGQTTILVGKGIIWVASDGFIVIAESIIEVSFVTIDVPATYIGWDKLASSRIASL